MVSTFLLTAVCAYLALGQLWLDGRPGLALGSIAQQVHDDCALLNSFVDLEQVGPWDPAILLGFLPRGTVLSYTDNDVQAVIPEVKTLAVALGAITDEGEGVILKVLMELLAWPVRPLWNSIRITFLSNGMELNLKVAYHRRSQGDQQIQWSSHLETVVAALGRQQSLLLW